MRSSFYRLTAAAAGVATGLLVVAWPAAPARAAIILQFDYTLDTNNFFPAGSSQRATLEAAGQTFSDRYVDTLSAITPGGSNSWTPNFSHPGTGATATLSNPTIPANTIRVFAGGRNLTGSTLGIGGPGGYSAGGNQAWFDTLDARGEPGALLSPPTDFAPWGGAITFDTTPSNPWNFNLSGPVGGQNDFFSVAVHELGHLLGLGTAESFSSLANGTNQFTGPRSVAANGGTPPSVTADRGHWAAGTNSTVGGAAQEAAMTPSITTGTRKRFTVLDFAGMDDLGWDLAGPGDANADGAVNGSDLSLLLNNFGTTSGARWVQGDFNGDLAVNGSDLSLLLSNFGAGAGGLAALSAEDAERVAALSDTSVPEPTGVGLMGIGGLGLLARRRRN